MPPQATPAPCPFLPVPPTPITAKDSRALGTKRGEPFYLLCLAYAQTKWLANLPGQALLQLNRAMSADLRGDEPCLGKYPVPYNAVAWILAARPDLDGHFFGNPRRHWQHYASRMSGPRSEIRSWRAWACWALAVSLLPEAEFPADGKQIAEESLILPSPDQIHEALKFQGFPDEANHWRAAMNQNSM